MASYNLLTYLDNVQPDVQTGPFHLARHHYRIGIHSFCRDDYPCLAGSGLMASRKDPDRAAAAAAPGRVFARLWVRGVEHSFLAPVAPVVNAPPGAVGTVGLRVDPYVWIIEGGCIRSGDGTLVWDAYDLSAAVPGAGQGQCQESQDNRHSHCNVRCGSGMDQPAPQLSSASASSKIALSLTILRCSLVFIVI